MTSWARSSVLAIDEETPLEGRPTVHSVVAAVRTRARAAAHRHRSGVPEDISVRHDEILGLTLSSELAREAPTLAALRARADDIARIVGAHGGRNVRVFGSVARGEARPGSDVDLLVDVERGTGLFGLTAMEIELEQLLGCSVDVVSSGHDRMAHIHEDAVSL